MEYDSLWKSLLVLEKKIAASSHPVSYCTMALEAEGEVTLNAMLPASVHRSTLVVSNGSNPDFEINAQEPFCRINGNLECCIENKGNLSQETWNFLKMYLPYCFLPLQARKKERAIAIAHFAQTLDGKIATPSGDSKWIGNQENLIHAHRMRALCDGILIGSNTLIQDKPSLTVRHVPGENPVKIVISSSENDYTSLLSGNPDKVIVLGTKKSSCPENCDFIGFPPTHTGRIAPKTILRRLYQEYGIHSVYIEGGPVTTSYFLAEKAIDILQIHISPLILGSGKSSFVLPPVDKISNSVKFNQFHFQPVGDTFMFVGSIN